MSATLVRFSPCSCNNALEMNPSFDLCASTATRRNDVGAAGDLLPLRRCFCESKLASVG